MKFSFDSTQGLIVIPAKIYGPKGDILLRLALDTGATGSMINWDLAVLIGYDPASSTERVQVTTGSGVEYAPRIKIKKIEALYRAVKNFFILCHTLPPSATVDGLLGLDFFRGTHISIDLKSGIIDLES